MLYLIRTLLNFMLFHALSVRSRPDVNKKNFIFLHMSISFPQLSIFPELAPHFPGTDYINLPDFTFHRIILNKFLSGETLLIVRLM